MYIKIAFFAENRVILNEIYAINCRRGFSILSCSRLKCRTLGPTSGCMDIRWITMNGWELKMLVDRKDRWISWRKWLVTLADWRLCNGVIVT